MIASSNQFEATEPFDLWMKHNCFIHLQYIIERIEIIFKIFDEFH